MEKILPAFEISLFDPILSDASIEMVEMGIDSMLDDGLFKSIPIVNVLIGVKRTAQNIHDRNLLRQTMKFIKTFNEKSISEEKVRKYREKLLENPHYAENELGRVIILLNSTIDLKKSEILAKFYREYINEVIDWDKFCELSDVNSRVFLDDIKLLIDVYNKQVTNTIGLMIYQTKRLESLGLIDSTMQTISISSNSNARTDKYIHVSELGVLYCKYGILG